MDIVLKQNDADFILKHLRDELESLCEREKELNNKTNEFKKNISGIKEGPLEALLTKTLLSLSDDIIKETQERKALLLKCIELLTVGSEVSNGVA